MDVCRTCFPCQLLELLPRDGGASALRSHPVIRSLRIRSACLMGIGAITRKCVMQKLGKEATVERNEASALSCDAVEALLQLGVEAFRLATCRNPSTAGTASTSVSVDYIARRTTVPPLTSLRPATICAS